MTSPVEKFLRRDFKKKSFEIDGDKMLLAGFLLFIAALIIHHKIEPTMGQIQGLLTPAVHAEEVRGGMCEYSVELEAKCAWIGLYPEKIINLKQAQRDCLANGTPVQML